MKTFTAEIDGVCYMYPHYFSRIDTGSKTQKYLLIVELNDDQFEEEFKVAFVYMHNGEVYMLKTNGLPNNSIAYNAADIKKVRIYASKTIFEHYRIMTRMGKNLKIQPDSKGFLFTEFTYTKSDPLFDDERYKLYGKKPVRYDMWFPEQDSTIYD